MIKNHIVDKNKKNPVSEVLEIENVKIFDLGLKNLQLKIREMTGKFVVMWECLQENAPDM
jgi:hypothetical protein